MADKNEDEPDQIEGKQEEKKEEPYPTSFSEDQLLYDRGYGCVIGAAIGDSIGSFCEFRKRKIDKYTVSTAMKMPGGGTWGKSVISGQVTDDTEMAVSLAYGLMDIIGEKSQMKREKQTKNATKDNLKKQYKKVLQSIKHKKKNNDKVDDEQKSKSHVFDLRKIALQYEKWKQSYPFDMGFCTNATLFSAPDVKKMKEAAKNYDIEKEREYHKGGNLANGAMMRCMPLCLYGYKLSEDNLNILMTQDASMTHCNSYVYLTNTCYALMVQSLLTADKNNDNRNKEAYDKMYKWLEKQRKKEKNGIGKAAENVLYNWLKYVDTELDNLQPATVTMGLVKIAFQRCCYHLLKKSTYKEAIQSVVAEGGDSDTNACIVGGIMGAYHGLSNISDEYIENIQNCNPTYDPHRNMFQAKWYFEDKVVELLLDNAPNDKQFRYKRY